MRPSAEQVMVWTRPPWVSKMRPMRSSSTRKDTVLLCAAVCIRRFSRAFQSAPRPRHTPPLPARTPRWGGADR
eukprot:2212850-Rhodomonas_salina.1